MKLEKAIKLLEAGELPPTKDLLKWLQELTKYRRDIQDGLLKRISFYD